LTKRLLALGSGQTVPLRVERAQPGNSQPRNRSNFMDQNKDHAMRGSEAMRGTTAGNTSGGESVTNTLARGKEAVGAAAAEAMDSASSDLRALRNDLNNLTETVTKFISQAGNEAAKSAREITSNVAGQVGGIASDMADRSADIAASATHQAKTFATELENMARRNPLGAIAGAVMIGVMIGMMGRRNG
jgi:ElaB/YqjD/DUF883 family membrane-anchored ribosome-binding protein